MLYENFCGINVNLYKTAIAIGVVDILSNLADIAIDLKFYSEFGPFQMVVLSLISMTILCNILLIHGTVALNRWLLIYWMALTAIRIILGVLMFSMIFSIAAHEAFLYSFEMTELVFLSIGLMIVWKLFLKIRERTQNNFSLLSESA